MRRKYRPRKRPIKGRKLNTRQKKQVKRLIAVQQELKYFETMTSSYSINSTGVTFSLSNVSQGDTDITRDGDRVYAKKMYIRGNVACSDETNIVRLIFYQWKPNTTPTLAQILLAGPTGSVDVSSQYSHDSRQMFKILYDKTFMLAGQGSTPETPVTPITKRFFNIILSKNLIHQHQFTAGGTTGTNQIYYLAISDSAVAAHPTLTMATKLMFTDS